MTTLDTVQTLTLCGMFIVIVMLLRRVNVLWRLVDIMSDDAVDLRSRDEIED